MAKLEKYTKTVGAYSKTYYREAPVKEIVPKKGERHNNVEDITVNVMLESGTAYDFQGDETSQNRLSRSGWAMQTANVLSIDWKTADNVIVLLTVTDIANILLEAGKKQSALWFV